MRISDWSSDVCSSDLIGGVQPAAQPDLDHAGIGRNPRKREEGGGGGRLKKADLVIAVGIEHLGKHFGERLVLDQSTGKANAPVETDKMRAGVDMDLVQIGRASCRERVCQYV